MSANVLARALSGSSDTVLGDVLFQGCVVALRRRHRGFELHPAIDAGLFADDLTLLRTGSTGRS